jgi:hypothetical protein
VATPTRAAAAMHGSSVGAVPSGGGHAAEVVTPVAAVVGVGAAEEHRHAGRESADGEETIHARNNELLRLLNYIYEHTKRHRVSCTA